MRRGRELSLARTSALMMALALNGLPTMARVSAQSAPPAWTPSAASPLQPIWSFDTKG